MALLEELMDVMRKRAELEELILMIVCGHPELVSSRWKVALQKEHAMKELYMVLMRPIQLQAQLNPRKRPDEEAGNAWCSCQSWWVWLHLQTRQAGATLKHRES
jgi:hypothetical protein